MQRCTQVLWKTSGLNHREATAQGALLEMPIKAEHEPESGALGEVDSFSCPELEDPILRVCGGRQPSGGQSGKAAETQGVPGSSRLWMACAKGTHARKGAAVSPVGRSPPFLTP